MPKHEHKPQWVEENGVWHKPGEAAGYGTTSVIEEHRDRYQVPKYDSPPSQQEPHRLAKEFGDAPYDTALFTEKERHDRRAQVRDGQIYRNTFLPDGSVGEAAPVSTAGARAIGTGSRDKYIWVMDQDGEMTLANPKAEMQRISPGSQITDSRSADSLDIQAAENFARVHHTSLSGGEDVAAAGEMRIAGGRLTYLNNKSGHFCPSPGQTGQAIRELYRRGLDLEQARTRVDLTDGETERGIPQEQIGQLLGYGPRDHDVFGELDRHNENKSAVLEELLHLGARPDSASWTNLLPSMLRRRKEGVLNVLPLVHQFDPKQAAAAAARAQARAEALGQDDDCDYADDDDDLPTETEDESEEKSESAVQKLIRQFEAREQDNEEEEEEDDADDDGETSEAEEDQEAEEEEEEIEEEDNQAEAEEDRGERVRALRQRFEGSPNSPESPLTAKRRGALDEAPAQTRDGGRVESLTQLYGGMY